MSNSPKSLKKLNPHTHVHKIKTIKLLPNLENSNDANHNKNINHIAYPYSMQSQNSNFNNKLFFSKLPIENKLFENLSPNHKNTNLKAPTVQNKFLNKSNDSGLKETAAIPYYKNSNNNYNPIGNNLIYKNEQQNKNSKNLFNRSIDNVKDNSISKVKKEFSIPEDKNQINKINSTPKSFILNPNFKKHLNLLNMNNINSNHNSPRTGRKLSPLPNPKQTFKNVKKLNFDNLSNLFEMKDLLTDADVNKNNNFDNYKILAENKFDSADVFGFREQITIHYKIEEKDKIEDETEKKNDFLFNNSLNYSISKKHSDPKNIRSDLDFKTFLKIYSIKNGSKILLTIFRYLNSKDLREVFNSGKRARILISNTFLEQSYSLINKIKNHMKSHFEFLKAKLIFSSSKENFLINLKINSRVVKHENCDKLENKSFTWGIFTSVYKIRQESITKNLHFLEERIVYKNLYKIDVDYLHENKNEFWICREYTESKSDTLQKCYIKPILCFKNDDVITFNVNIYSDKGCIEFEKTNFIIKSENTKIDQISPSKILNKKDINHNPRVCEFETIKNYWKEPENFPGINLVIEKIKKIFALFFDIQKIYYDDVGYIIFKIVLLAKVKGKIENSQELGINLIIKDKKEIIKNEVKKNYLIYDKRDILELRVNDTLIFYFSHFK